MSRHVLLHEPPSLTVIVLTVVGMHQRLIAFSPSETPNLTSFPKKKNKKKTSLHKRERQALLSVFSCTESRQAEVWLLQLPFTICNLAAGHSVFKELVELCF